jgi:DNA (cytosine-5)-methyltransferase 1
VTDLTFYEFFCGGGGARAGLGDGWQCLLANDNDPAKMRSYTDNWGERGAITRDVAALTPADLSGVASLGWASFPCQDLSEAGAGAGLNGYRSNALWSCLEQIDALRAKGRPLPLIVLENVVGLMSPRSMGFLDAICDRLTAMGYRFGALEIDAALFVPQSRERVFVVAVDAALPAPAGVTMAEPSKPFHPPSLVAAMRRQKAAPIWWRLPAPPVRNTAFADLIEDNPTGVPWHDKVETERLISMMAPAHLAKVADAKRASIATGRKMVGGLYRRMRPAAGGEDVAGQRVQRAEVRFDDVAGCLRVPSGGSSRQTILVVDGGTVRSRLLSPREAARLMGFGDDYRLPSNVNEALGLMGDGLAIQVVRHLTAHVLEPVLRANNLSLVAE